ncbi:MAG: divalent metal cation transporter [Coraliomargaritaceae bacterium]
MDASTDVIESIQKKGPVHRLLGYARLTGPGWLQSAVTLGGGSLASALYLGIVAGYSLMWLQPLAMLCGVIMLMALAQVTLEKGKYPFVSVKTSISPLLAWGWLVATVIADIVFCTAQSSLGVATVQQNLGLSGTNPFIITSILSLIAFAAAALYAMGSSAVKKLELILKILVALVMVSFAAAAGFLLFSGKVDLDSVLLGFIPNPKALFQPAASLQPLIDATGDSAAYWTQYISDIQRSRIIAAFGTAVGINMTFLLPYTLLKRNWSKIHQELSRFDLVLALFLPFSVATALLVVSAASAFHASDADVLDSTGKPTPTLANGYYSILEERLASSSKVFESTEEMRHAADTLPLNERRLAAAITNRDAKQLAHTLAPLMGERMANLVFGIGILAMALSTMMVHCLMNGFAVSQAMGTPGEIKPFIIGAALPAFLAIFAPLVWSGDAKVALLIPAAVIATVFLPIAYLSILLLMNSRTSMEKPPARWINACMVVAAGIATYASVWMLSSKGTTGLIGIAGLLLFALIGILSFLKQQKVST